MCTFGASGVASLTFKKDSLLMVPTLADDTLDETLVADYSLPPRRSL